MVQAEAYQFPQRAPSTVALWDHLERWLSLGSEVEASGFEMPEWMRAAAILKLVPREMESQIVARPELRSYPPAPGLGQSTARAPARCGPSSDAQHPQGRHADRGARRT